MTAQIHPLAGRTNDGFIARFAMKDFPKHQPQTREWIDDFIILIYIP